MRNRERAHRAWGYLAGLGATAAVLSPLVTAQPDSFPISTYPMFSRSRGSPVIDAVVGVSGNGADRPLPPSLIASGEVLQTKALIARAVQHGRAGMAELCGEVAQRVAATELAGTLRAVAIVRRRYDPLRYFLVGPSPLEREQLFECALPEHARRAGALRGAP